MRLDLNSAKVLHHSKDEAIAGTEATAEVDSGSSGHSIKGLPFALRDDRTADENGSSFGG